jgi:hypothetical protein
MVRNIIYLYENRPMKPVEIVLRSRKGRGYGRMMGR